LGQVTLDHHRVQGFGAPLAGFAFFLGKAFSRHLGIGHWGLRVGNIRKIQEIKLLENTPGTKKGREDGPYFNGKGTRGFVPRFK
jgi:hypothetical protein